MCRVERCGRGSVTGREVRFVNGQGVVDVEVVVVRRLGLGWEDCVRR